MLANCGDLGAFSVLIGFSFFFPRSVALVRVLLLVNPVVEGEVVEMQ